MCQYEIEISSKHSKGSKGSIPLSKGEQTVGGTSFSFRGRNRNRYRFYFLHTRNIDRIIYGVRSQVFPVLMGNCKEFL